jgi:hypothetical protein
LNSITVTKGELGKILQKIKKISPHCHYGWSTSASVTIHKIRHEFLIRASISLKMSSKSHLIFTKASRFL